MSAVGCHVGGHSDFENWYRAARTSFERGELAQASEIADRGLRDTARSSPEWNFCFHVEKAELLAWQGKPKDALVLLQAAPPLALANSEPALRRLIVIGTADYLLQQFDDSARMLAQAEAMASAQYPALLGEVVAAQGTLATYKRDFASAENLNLKTLELARREKSRYLEARALASLGFMSLRQEHYGEAIDWFTPSLNLSREIGNRTFAAKILGNLGWCYFKLGDYEKAAEMLDRAEQLSAELGLVKDQFLWLTNIGSVHYEQRDFAGARHYYEQALAIARRLDNQPGAAACLSNLAATALETLQYETAEAYNREAITLKQAIGDRPSELYSKLNEARIAAGRKQYADAKALLKEIVANSGDNLSLRWEAESQLANVHALAGENVFAEMEFRKALSTIDKARASLAKEEYRLSFLGSAERFYNDYLDFLVSSGRAREALRVAEHSRAKTLSEGLKISLSGIDTKRFHPQEVARRLRGVILSYWLKPERSYLWVVTASGVSNFTLPGEEQIDVQAKAYRRALMGPRDPRETRDASGTGLYQALLEPAQGLIARGARVAVIGNGSINSLNFATLLVPNPRPHYWIEDVTVTSVSSIGLLSGTARVRGEDRKSILLIGNPVYSQGEYSELKQAQLEVQKVSQHFALEQRTVLEGPEATAAAYASSGPARFSYIHFVAHGTASRTSPLDSSIILSPQGDQRKLYARDLMKEPLRAELVTLSACYGAGARAYSGEGLVGLSWAFLRAGAHNVVAALWEVSDNSTPQLMDTMYEKLSQREDPVAALRDAQLAMLHSGTVYRRPYYWGAFQVYSTRP